MKQSIVLLPGASGIKAAYEMAAKSTKLKVQCLSSGYEQIIGDYFDKDFQEAIVRNKISVMEIIPSSKSNEEYMKEKGNNLVKLVDASSESDIIVCDDCVILISFNKTNPFAVVINDAELNRGFNTLHDTAFESK